MWNSSYSDYQIFMREILNPPEIQIDPFLGYLPNEKQKGHSYEWPFVGIPGFEPGTLTP